ncbi:phosphatase PAP2 family protein [Chitinophaga vietnamensis]|uniref:phosphatase PAP2 family protein n=1 Tax=Chitinophaga vietnamensis TaxID=2593957 RepID=UPI001177B74B|nr:phosphatase PAP2 family protein [Chitinophaga vietnamensis]
MKLGKVCKALGWLLWPFAMILLIALVLKLMYTREEIYFYINHLHTPAGDWLFPYITELGSTAVAVTLVVLLFIRSRRMGFVMATTYCFTTIINFVLKFVVAFPRPHRYFEHRLSEIYFVPGITVLDNFRSFPSGHSACAFTAATVLSYYSNNKAWSLLYLLLALLVAYSRMYMSQHFFEDVVAGAFVGIFFSMLWLAYVDGKGYAASRP